MTEPSHVGAGQAAPCADVRARLDELLDGTLPAEAEPSLRRHLSGCPACRGAAEHHRRFLEAVRRTARSERAPSALWDRILRALRACRTAPREETRRKR